MDRKVAEESLRFRGRLHRRQEGEQTTGSRGGGGSVMERYEVGSMDVPRVLGAPRVTIRCSEALRRWSVVR